MSLFAPQIPLAQQCVAQHAIGDRGTIARIYPYFAMVHNKCACIRVRRASRSLTDLYDEALWPVGLKITQFSLLRTVARMEPVNISSLADAMALDRSTLGRNLGVLKRRGLVGVSDGTDLRERTVTLTARATRLLKRAVPLWEEAQERVSAVLGKSGASTLFALLAKLEALR